MTKKPKEPCMLTEESILDQVTAQWVPAVAADKAAGIAAQPDRWVLNVRRSDRVMREDTLVSETYHRRVIEKGDDLSDLPPMVAKVAAAVWGK